MAIPQQMLQPEPTFQGEAIRKLRSLSGLVQNLSAGVGNVANASPTRMIGATQIVSRTYVAAALEGNEHLPDIMNWLLDMYVATLMNAVELTQYVDSVNTVQDMLAPIATEMALTGNSAPLFGMTPFLHTYATEGFVSDLIAPGTTVVQGQRDPRGQSPGARVVGMGTPELKAAPLLPTGRTLTMTLRPVGKDGMQSAMSLIPQPKAGPANKVAPTKGEYVDRRFDITLTVRLRPFIVPQDAVLSFLCMNYVPTIHQRFMQYSDGEISFFKDLLLCNDIIKMRENIRRRVSIADDYLSAMQAKRTNIFGRMLRSWVNGSVRGETTLNMANTIMIISQKDAEGYKATTGRDLVKDGRARNQFMADSMCMFLVIIDPMANRVQVCINTYGAISIKSATSDDGLYGEYKCTDFKPKKRDPSDTVAITEMVKLLMGGRLPTL